MDSAEVREIKRQRREADRERTLALAEARRVKAAARVAGDPR
jgi:hypothetical protein